MNRLTDTVTSTRNSCSTCMRVFSDHTDQELLVCARLLLSKGKYDNTD